MSNGGIMTPTVTKSTIRTATDMSNGWNMTPTVTKSTKRIVTDMSYGVNIPLSPMGT